MCLSALRRTTSVLNKDEEHLRNLTHGGTHERRSNDWQIKATDTQVHPLLPASKLNITYISSCSSREFIFTL